MKRVAELQEIAGPLLFLASDAASFITDMNLLVDGAGLLGHWLYATNFSG